MGLTTCLFEVLEAAGDPIDDELAGGGAYSLEGFPSQTCN
jgi:hypothetical protein